MYHVSFFKKAIPHYKKGVELHLIANHTVALEYFKFAAELKYPPAFYMLYIYFSEPSNILNLPYLADADSLAKKYLICLGNTSSWFKDAADSGNNDARYVLSRLYSGQYFTRNLRLEQFYLNKAAMDGSLSAKVKLIEIDHDIDNAFRQCSKLVSDLSGFATAHFLLASMYEKGSGVAKNISLAIEEHEKAAQLGHVDSAYRYFLLNKQRGNSTKQAEQFCSQAAQANHFLAQLTYRRLCYKTDELEEDNISHELSKERFNQRHDITFSPGLADLKLPPDQKKWIEKLFFPSRWSEPLSSFDFESIWPLWKRKQAAELVTEEDGLRQVVPPFLPSELDMLPPPYSPFEMSAPQVSPPSPRMDTLPRPPLRVGPPSFRPLSEDLGFSQEAPRLPEKDYKNEVYVNTVEKESQIYELRLIENQHYNSVEDKVTAIQKILVKYSERINRLETEQFQLKQQQLDSEKIMRALDRKKQTYHSQLQRLEAQLALEPDNLGLRSDIATLKANQYMLMIEYNQNQTKRSSQARIANHDCLLLCYNNLQYKLNAWVNAYMVLSTGKVQAHSNNKMQAISILGDSLSFIPGFEAVSTTMRVAMEYKQQRKKKHEALGLASLGVGTGAMNEWVESFARELVLHYETALCQLTTQGATQFGQWCAKPIIEWLYVVKDEQILKPDQMVNTMLDIIKQGGVSESTQTLHASLADMRAILQKDYDVALQQGGTISVRRLLKYSLRKETVDSKASRTELISQRTELEAIKVVQERQQLTQEISFNRSHHGLNGSVRLSEQTYRQLLARIEKLEGNGASFANERHLPNQQQRSHTLQSFKPSSYHPERRYNTEAAIYAYDGQQSGGFGCKVEEEFYILTTEHREWIYVQRVSNDEKGYLPRNRFLFD